MKSALVLIGLLIATPVPSSQEISQLPSVRMIDLDGNGRLDRLRLDEDGSISVHLNRGDRRFDEVPQVLPKVDVSSVLVHDLNRDGFVDLYLVSPGDNIAFLGDGTGRLTEATNALGLADGGVGVGAETLDIDEDGLEDVLLHNALGDVVFWGSDFGAFERDPATPVAHAPRSAETSGLIWSVPSSGPGLYQMATVGGIPLPALGSALPLASFPTCAKTIEDQATGMCIRASSVPELGKLLPLSPDLFVSTSGDVGLGTVSPAAKLDVAGSVAVQSAVVINSAGEWVGSPTGLVGPQGPQGIQGIQGAEGPSFGVKRILQGTVIFASGQNTVSITLPTGGTPIVPSKSFVTLSNLIITATSGSITTVNPIMSGLTGTTLTVQRNFTQTFPNNAFNYQVMEFF